MEELNGIVKDEFLESYLNTKIIKGSIKTSEVFPASRFIFDPNFKTLIRSIVVSRFLRNF